MVEIIKTHKATRKEILDFISSLPKKEQRAAYRAAVIMGNL
nr:MAG TPA: Plasmid stability protein [Caudoviricetes sp.]